jgi:glycosyltransferase involved in cell wall biosynthesis
MTRLAARGHEVQVLCSDEKLPDVADIPEPFPVRRALTMYWRDELPWKPSLPEQLKVERANQAALDAAIDDLRPEVVSVWHMAAISLNLLTTTVRRGIPIVYAICDSWPTYTLVFDPWSKRFNRGRFGRAAGHLVERTLEAPTVLPDLGAVGHACFVSAFTRDDVQANSPWTFPHPEIIPSGIDRTNLRSDASPPDKAWKWRLAYFGRFDPRKGTDTLLRAMPLLPPEASLAMYGRGGESERHRLGQLAGELGVKDRVTFGSLDREELAAAYRSADAVVFPSEWPEPFGLVPLEAMECRTPVVATGVGGSADFLEDGVNCVLFQPGDHEDLARALLLVARDVPLRQRVITAGAATAISYDVEHMADAYEKALVAAVGSTSEPSGPAWDSPVGPG